MTAKGHPHAHFLHSIELGHLLSAETAARQLGRLSHTDALALTLLIREKAPARFPRTAARWHARLVIDTPEIGLATLSFSSPRWPRFPIRGR